MCRQMRGQKEEKQLTKWTGALQSWPVELCLMERPARSPAEESDRSAHGRSSQGSRPHAVLQCLPVCFFEQVQGQSFVWFPLFLEN